MKDLKMQPKQYLSGLKNLKRTKHKYTDLSPSSKVQTKL